MSSGDKRYNKTEEETKTNNLSIVNVLQDSESFLSRNRLWVLLVLLAIVLWWFLANYNCTKNNTNYDVQNVTLNDKMTNGPQLGGGRAPILGSDYLNYADPSPSFGLDTDARRLFRF